MKIKTHTKCFVKNINSNRIAQIVKTLTYCLFLCKKLRGEFNNEFLCGNRGMYLYSQQPYVYYVRIDTLKFEIRSPLTIIYT